MRLSIDIETACAVPSCKYHGKAMCQEGHSLSPWHSRITVIGLVGFCPDTAEILARGVFRGPSMIEELQEYLDDNYWPDGAGGANFKFDLLHLWVRGLKFPVERWTFDTQLAGYVLTEKIPDSYIEDLKRRAPKGQNHRFGKHSLKTMAPYFLGVEPFWEVEDKDNDEYVLKDAEYTARLAPVLETKLRERGEFEFYKERQLEWTKMLLEAEFRGIQLDMGALDQKEGDLQSRSQELRSRLDSLWASAHAAYREQAAERLLGRYKQMAAKAGKPFAEGSRYFNLFLAAAKKLPGGVDYDSPAQMLWLLRDYLGYNVTSLEGDETTGREVLERLADEGKEDVRTYLEWRKVNKMLTAFLPTYREAQTGGVIHAIFNPTNTRTGRLSSERPNLQQVNSELKKLFKPRPGYKFISYDFAGIEAKVIALYSEDPALFEIVTKGISIHDYSAKAFLGLDVPVEQVKEKYPVERAATKNCLFGLFYNAGPKRIQATFAQKGIHLSQGDCRQIHGRFKETYSAAAKFMRELVKYLESGAVIMNLLGRPLRIEHPEDCYMKGFNSAVQGSASDLCLEAANRTRRDYRERGIDAHVLLLIHDNIVVEAKEEQVPEAEEILVENMLGFNLTNSLGRIPLEVDGGVYDYWK
jgi:DNA polymerase I-like protein with 3'-5' exonuclease and polymerase domains